MIYLEMFGNGVKITSMHLNVKRNHLFMMTFQRHAMMVDIT
jgi:hypothetical protein